MKTLSRNLPTTGVKITLPGSLTKQFTHRAAAAISEAAIHDVLAVTVTDVNSIELEVTHGTLHEQLRKDLFKALTLVGSPNFVIDAPEDGWRDAQLVLTVTGWKYQLHCSDCGSYEDDIEIPIIDHVCDDCIERSQREEAESED